MTLVSRAGLEPSLVASSRKASLLILIWGFAMMVRARPQ